MPQHSSASESLTREEFIVGLALGLRGNDLDVSEVLLSEIEKSPGAERAALLRALCEHWDLRRRDECVEEVPIKYTDQQLEDLKNRFGRVVDGMLEALVQMKMAEEEFYCRLYSDVVSSPFLSGEGARAFALYWILVDKKIPYFRVDIAHATRMPDAEYRRVMKLLNKHRAKVRFVQQLKLEQRTQVADLVLEVFDSLTDRRERVVLMSAILSERETLGGLDLVSELHKALRS